jgi:NAD-dependent SIR2 family protein deacetylase
LTDIHEFARRHPRLFVLTGAGISTDSGIPGYRNDDGRWQRSPPVTLQEFLGSDTARRRYWARSMRGWPLVAGAQPNAAHRALVRLEAARQVQLLVTQNVDGLHQRAGSSGVVELHGGVGRVICLGCGARHSRAALQRALEADNPAFAAPTPAPAAAPDGDADVELHDLAAFRVPACAHCGGMLKPDVVLFGDAVPRERVDLAMRGLEQADALLVVGSSLMVYSGFRFCERARRLGKPIAAINRGRTRADHLFTVKVERSCAEVLSALAADAGQRPGDVEARVGG